MEHLVFVYGTLKRDYGNNVLLRDSEFLGEARSVLDRYVMRAPAFGGFPFTTEVSPKNKNRGRVFGEIYRVDDETLQRLDALEGHPDFYTRHKKQFKFMNNDKEVTAWIYLHPEVNYPLCPMFNYNGEAVYYWDPLYDNEEKMELIRAA